MPLRKSPTRTPAMLAANRANSLKCTGPRTARGKARAALNSLKHGRYAPRLLQTLLRAGDHQGAQQYLWFCSEIAATFRASEAGERRQAGRLAARAWCVARDLGRFGTKPERCSEIRANWPLLPSLFPIRIVDQWRRIGLVFWVRRPRYWTLERHLRILVGLEPLAPPPPGCRLEQRWRRLRFRTRKPGLWERQKLEARARKLGVLRC